MPRVAALLVVALAVAACSTGGAAGDGRLRVVAAENMWGSIAAQLGGDRVEVRSIIDSPAADPHDYEPVTADARAVASASVVVANGLGYDSWATKLMAANPDKARADLVVGDLVGADDGDNPHRWYSPDDVMTVADAITAAYGRLDPRDRAYFAQQHQKFATTGTAGYRAAIADIKARFAGRPVGASESIFAMLAPALELDLVTPPGFLRAISEGSDPTPADKATADAQITEHRIDVYVYNRQNATPDVQAQLSAARAAGIPVAAITETTVPSHARWQDWQTAQLQDLRGALEKAHA